MAYKFDITENMYISLTIHLTFGMRGFRIVLISAKPYFICQLSLYKQRQRSILLIVLYLSDMLIKWFLPNLMQIACLYCVMIFCTTDKLNPLCISLFQRDKSRLTRPVPAIYHRYCKHLLQCTAQDKHELVLRGFKPKIAFSIHSIILSPSSKTLHFKAVDEITDCFMSVFNCLCHIRIPTLLHRYQVYTVKPLI